MKMEANNRTAAFASRGPAPSIGLILSERADSKCAVYALALSGAVEALFPLESLTGKLIVKIGRSNDVRRRCQELNDGFPPGSALQWQVRAARWFSTVDAAHEAEQAMLTALEREGKIIGREFALLACRDLEGLFPKGSTRSRLGSPCRPPPRSGRGRRGVRLHRRSETCQASNVLEITVVGEKGYASVEVQPELLR